ncbi:phage shock protein operon transcriptional activator [Pseudohaliea sp.]|uniref:phage shock protein operon transcriptional activator n=1 Tax=Pseudohaliea sp. TaxID=2740289 RepID=UPI0032EB1FC2
MRAPDSMIGNSEALAAALDHLSRLAPVNRPVIVLGERGTGKELAAERLHFLSARWDAPFIKVNCAAMAESLLESELFGHEPGAFTGATAMHRGRFERADGGTLFLDELGTTSARLQEKLLRLVEYGEFERLGGQRTLQVDVRVVAATHADLPALAAAGEFRHDLLDRLGFDVVYLPPLRERREDIEELAEHFAIQMSAELGWDLFPGFSAGALARLREHPWPGNVRELKNAVERSVYRWGDPSEPVAEVVLDPFAEARPIAPDAAPPAEALSVAPQADAGDAPLRERVDAYERRLLEDALARHGHHQKHTAEALGLSYDQLRGLLRRHGLRSRRRRRDTATDR